MKVELCVSMWIDGEYKQRGSIVDLHHTKAKKYKKRGLACSPGSKPTIDDTDEDEDESDDSDNN